MNTIGYNASRNFNKSLNQNIQNASINPSLFKCASINNQNDVYETAKVTPFQKAKFFFNRLFSSCMPNSKCQDEISPVIAEQSDTLSLDSNLPAEINERRDFTNIKKSKSILIDNPVPRTDYNFTPTSSPYDETSCSSSPFYTHSYNSKEEIIKNIFKTII